MEPTVLNLGCGRKKMRGAVNLDITSATDPDVIHNLNLRPWPLPNNHFTEVHANDVIEHLDDILAVMEEIHRVCRDAAHIHITVPHFSSPNAFTDPTHRHYFGWFSFDYFTGEHEHSYYSRTRFRMVNRKLMFHSTLPNRIVRLLQAKHPAAYERVWAWIFPAWFLWFELKVVKIAE